MAMEELPDSRLDADVQYEEGFFGADILESPSRKRMQVLRKRNLLDSWSPSRKREG